MEEASRDFDSFVGRVLTRGLEGLMFRCVLVSERRRAYEVFQAGKGSPVLWTVIVERWKEPGSRDIVGEMRKGLRKDRRKGPRP